MTVDIAPLVISFALGIAAGSFYFGGLWLTLQGLATARRPKLRLAVSFTLRMGLLLAIFYGLSDRGMGAMLAAMAGVLVARQLWLVGKGRIRPAREA